jgi:hypothetical protein
VDAGNRGVRWRIQHALLLRGRNGRRYRGLVVVHVVGTTAVIFRL